MNDLNTSGYDPNKCKLKEGICLVKACDRYLLVPLRSKRREFPYINMINSGSALYFRMLKKGYTPDGMADEICSHFPVKREQAEAWIHQFLKQMQLHNYLETPFQPSSNEGEDH